MDGNVNCSADQEKISFCEQHPATLFSSGEPFAISASTSEQDCPKRGSTAQRFAMLEKKRAATLYAKRIELLMSSGLIAGITPTSVRRTLKADCRALASSLLVGDTYEFMGAGRELSAEAC
jgi:hypothetical protein